ncbi:MAG: hypothetical protein RKR03_12515 [Candidatus Competibacter sp.]|nr:hypothetical protein [Candidatus Competibacter sp.]
MNDPTEFESSLAGAIDFFQNLRRKLGALEADSGAQYDRLHAVATTVATLEQDRQQIRQSLATLAGDLRAQSIVLRQELNTLEQRIVPVARIEPLEEQLENHQTQLGLMERTARTGQERLEQFAAQVEAHYQRLLQFETALETRDRDSQSILHGLTELRTELEQHTQALDTLSQAVESGESARMRLETRQNRLDELAELSIAARQELQKQQERLKHLEILMGKVSADTNSTRQVLNVLQTDLTTQSDTLRELDQNWRESLAACQTHPSQPQILLTGFGLEAQAPTDDSSASLSGARIELAPLRETLASQARALADLREVTRQQFADLSTRIENQRLEYQDASERIGHLQQDIQRYQAEQSSPAPAIEHPAPFPETSTPEARQLRQDLDTLQEMVTALATRLIGQAQTFGDYFEQFRGLNADIRDLQQQFGKLESPPRQLSALERGLAVQEQELILLKDAIRQIQADSPSFEADLRQAGHDSRIAELETRLGERSEHLTGLTTTIETIQTEVRVTQEKVVTLATNVVEWIQEFQHQLAASETTQNERLQGVDQELVRLRATLETLETQRKSRRWFSMPATFSILVLAVGTALLVILAQAI